MYSEKEYVRCIRNSFSHVTVVTLYYAIPRPLFRGIFLLCFSIQDSRLVQESAHTSWQDDVPPQEEVWLRARGSDNPGEVAAEQFQVPPRIHHSKVLHSWHRGKWSIVWSEDLNTKFGVPILLQQYFSTRDKYSIHDGLIFWGQRSVIPQGMRKQVKDLLHRSHLGMESTLRRTRECLFWPGMIEIKQVVQNCSACQTY